MKTTIDLPDDLLHRAKIVAAQRKTTLKELISSGLSKEIGDSEEEKAKKRKEAIDKLLEGLKAKNTEPMVPLTREEIYNR